MILGIEVNQWGEPVTPKSKPRAAVEKKQEPIDEPVILEDVYMTLRFLSEITEAEPSIDEKKDSLLKKARLARESYKFAQESFLNGMESLGVSRDEARVLWADADV